MSGTSAGMSKPWSYMGTSAASTPRCARVAASNTRPSRSRSGLSTISATRRRPLRMRGQGALDRLDDALLLLGVEVRPRRQAEPAREQFVGDAAAFLMRKILAAPEKRL